MKARDKIIQAKSDIILSHPFFAYLNCKLEYVEDPTCPTMWTNGKKIGYNPEYVDKMTLAQTTGTIVHEVMHCADGHHWRREGRNKDDWNLACDFAIDPMIRAAGFTQLDETIDPRFKGMSAEQIYSIIHKEGEDKDKGGCFPGAGGRYQSPGEVRDCPEEKKEVEAVEWQQSVLNAAKIAQAQGQMPKGMERLLDEIKNPAIDWKAALRRFMETCAKNDFTWRRPNQKYLSCGLYMPSLQSEQMPPVVILWDTSGSLDDRESRAMIAGECASIISEVRPEKTYVIYCDAEVQGDVAEFGPDEPIKFKPIGGGGTDFRPAFDWVQEHGVQPACFIAITDLCGTFPDVAPDYPVIWAATTTTTKVKAPFGETITVQP